MSKKAIALVTTVVIALVAIAAAVAWFVPVFKVESIEINGAVRTDTEVAREVSGITAGDNLLRIDATGAAHAIAEMPWVSSVTLNRRLPSTVEITLTEREAAVFIRRPDGEHIIDTEGQPIVVGTPPVGTVEVTGIREDDPEVLPAVIDIIRAIDDYDPELRNIIATIEAPDQFDVLLRLTDGREVYWGSSENNHDKAVALSTVVQREGQRWNISSPSMVTVR
ncbi:POTRA domain protein, FtsQ-type [Corynebacterium efficiens YS-314]|uniref:Cell division protein FtsQ n=1 Tax=Corynebacterium efficiens (strain DSM 44549 / YS-314 / AJ 12310 / JCM 11189 / NBRC 100395) TaxID=196164 RepID=Q8FNU2_COREF|nr:FtsQ-type POTRA domain-containing protein [Corynebacterium efficiens]EEW49266.1 POTRA domain protein, FtsQ-type [Corynebacterium efficiens YS-314]BAC18861.1 cell division protein FtsQ [Corynebacterium efficiens YS-314]